MKKVLIFNYHLIADSSEACDALGDIYRIEREAFEKQMVYIKKANIPVVSLNDILENNLQEELSLAITFDDGNMSDYEIVYPILKQYGFTATFFLCIDNFKKNNLAWEKYIELSNNGFEIGSHGISHADLSTLFTEKARSELVDSKLIIEKQIHKQIDFFSFPYGKYTSTLLENAREIGYKAVLSTEFNYNYPSEESFLLHRITVKNNTAFSTFTAIIDGDEKTIQKLIVRSKLKQRIIRVFGTKIINNLNILKSKF
ncbi:MAG: polysaccharide deacetylase family protein [Fluviicola sp.]